jgi:hypothetical protein
MNDDDVYLFNVLKHQNEISLKYWLRYSQICNIAVQYRDKKKPKNREFSCNLVVEDAYTDLMIKDPVTWS